MFTVVLGLAVAIAMFWTEDPTELSRVWSTARNDYLLAGVLLVIITLFINTVRWYTLLHQLGYDAGFIDVFCQVSGPFVVSSLTPGRAGEVFKLYAAKRISCIDVSHSSAALLIERACDLSVMTSFILLGLVTGLEPQLGAYASAAYATVAFTMTVIAVIVLSVRHPGVLAMVVRVLELGGRVGLPGCGRGAKKIDECAPAFHSVAGRINLPLILGITACVWVLDVARMWVLFKALGVNVPLVPIGFVYCLSLLLGIVSYVPGGLGVTEGSMVVLFGLFAVPGTQAKIAVLIERVFSFWLALFIGSMALSYKADVLLFDLSSGDMPDLTDAEAATCPADEDDETK